MTGRKPLLVENGKIKKDGYAEGSYGCSVDPGEEDQSGRQMPDAGVLSTAMVISP